MWGCRLDPVRAGLQQHGSINLRSGMSGESHPMAACREDLKCASTSMSVVGVHVLIIAE